MTNAASNNQIDAYARREDGTLEFSAAFSTGGNGSRGTLDPLHSQGRSRSAQTIPSLHHERSAYARSCYVIAQQGRSVYTSNAGDSTLSGFNIERNGALTPIGATVVSQNPTISTNINVAASEGGRYLYTLSAATGAIGIFVVQEDGGGRLIAYLLELNGLAR